MSARIATSSIRRISDEATAADLAEQQQILDSISISEPASDDRLLGDPDRLGDPVGASRAPYVATLKASTNDMRGPAPVAFAELTAATRPDRLQTTPGVGLRCVRLTRPAGTVTRPAYDLTDSNFQGSMFFDAPGAWLAELEGVNPACPHTFLSRRRATMTVAGRIRKPNPLDLAHTL